MSTSRACDVDPWWWRLRDSDIALDAGRVAPLRHSLIGLLPRPQGPVLQQLWTWAPFTPWSDCAAGIAFRVMQACRGEEHLTVNEPS
jgi:hypothetical protein